LTLILIVLHVIVCVFLVAVVLLQRGKGAEIGAVFGGGASSTVFGSRGAGTFLSKLTTASAAVFMMTSLSLSYIYTQDSGERLFEDGVTQEEAAAAAAGEFEEIGTVEIDVEPEPISQEIAPTDTGLEGEAATAGEDEGTAEP
jgi:preprotein translocase subunit SecG